jgi:hypothetical protein
LHEHGHRQAPRALGAHPGRRLSGPVPVLAWRDAPGRGATAWTRSPDCSSSGCCWAATRPGGGATGGRGARRDQGS